MPRAAAVFSYSRQTRLQLLLEVAPVPRGQAHLRGVHLVEPLLDGAGPPRPLLGVVEEVLDRPAGHLPMIPRGGVRNPARGLVDQEQVEACAEGHLTDGGDAPAAGNALDQTPGGQQLQRLVQAGVDVEGRAEQVGAVVEGALAGLLPRVGVEEQVVHGAGLVLADLAAVVAAGGGAAAGGAGQGDGHLVGLVRGGDLGSHPRRGDFVAGEAHLVPGGAHLLEGGEVLHEVLLKGSVEGDRLGVGVVGEGAL